MQQSTTTSKQPATLSPVESQSIMLFLEMTTEKCAVLFMDILGCGRMPVFGGCPYGSSKKETDGANTFNDNEAPL